MSAQTQPCSWVESANGHSDFSLANLPLGVFSRDGQQPRGGVAIGDYIFDLSAAREAGLTTAQTVKLRSILDPEGNALGFMATPHFLEPGDIIIDGGNSNYNDSIRRTAYVESKGLLFIGAGVSGGEEGARLGPSIIPGGSPEAWPHVKPIFQDIAAKVDDGVPCCDWVGENGAGHFVKMVHNGIEYGMMQAFAEGFALMEKREEFSLDLAAIAESWRHGSVVRSWLLDLSASVLEEDQDLDSIDAYVADSGEGRWTALEGLEQKYYLHNPETGEYGGFYVWRSLDDVVAYRASDLAASIAAAYQAVAAPEITVYEIVMPLRT